MKFHVLIDRERCKGCALCVAACERGVLRISSDLNSKGSSFAEVNEPEACVGCRKCGIMCPDAAIEIERETGAPPGTPSAKAVKNARRVRTPA